MFPVLFVRGFIGTSVRRRIVKPAYNGAGRRRMSSQRELLSRIYAAFNRREIETVLSALHPDVDWPNGMEGGRVLGHDAVRAYWTRQFQILDPHVEPKAFTAESDCVVVDVEQVVHDMSGKLLVNQMIQHVYQFRDGLVWRMDIRAV